MLGQLSDEVDNVLKDSGSFRALLGYYTQDVEYDFAWSTMIYCFSGSGIDARLN